MKFFKPKDIEDFEPLSKLLSPEKFITEMVKVGELKEVKGDYRRDCKFLCHNAVVWALKQLKETLFFYETKVCTGTFNNWEHSWLQIGDYYIDLTLAQFVEDAPKLAISIIEENNGYTPEIISSPEQFINTIKDTMGVEK